MFTTALKRTILIIGTLALLMVLSGCAEVQPIQDCVQGEPAGFWKGLWHGIILPFSFILSLLQDDVAIYAVYNNGGWYNLGYVLGAGTFLGGSGSSASRR